MDQNLCLLWSFFVEGSCVYCMCVWHVLNVVSVKDHIELLTLDSQHSWLVILCVCVCVCERERERERDTYLIMLTIMHVGFPVGHLQFCM